MTKKKRRWESNFRNIVFFCLRCVYGRWMWVFFSLNRNLNARCLCLKSELLLSTTFCCCCCTWLFSLGVFSFALFILLCLRVCVCVLVCLTIYGNSFSSCIMKYSVFWDSFYAPFYHWLRLTFFFVCWNNTMLFCFFDCKILEKICMFLFR